MTDAAIVDTGPLVAFLDADEEHHAWAVETFRTLRAPLLTCEPVLAETMHLVRRSPAAQDLVFEWVARGAIVLAFDLADECAAVRRLMRKYRDVPMSLADACVVRMSETIGGHLVCTLDEDFRVYRRDGDTPIPLRAPSSR